MRLNHDIHHGDSATMTGVKDSSVDLVVTSPPYPMIRMWDALFSYRNPEIRKALAREDGLDAFSLMHNELDRTWKEVSRVLKPGGIACINIGDATRTMGGRFELFPNHSAVINSFKRLGFTTLTFILWSKPTNKPTKYMGSGMLPAGAYVTLEHEFILVFRNGAPRYFSKEESARRRQSSFFWEERNEWFSDHWTGIKGARQGPYPSGSADRSAAFPLEVPLRLISMYSLVGDSVLDPFLGAGTTMLAAIFTGRASQGYESNKVAATSAPDRLLKGADEAREYPHLRLERHKEYLESLRSTGRTPKYISRVYGLPVMTRQEVEISMPVLRSLSKVAPAVLEAAYEFPVP